jgi:hypothetical protein
MGSNRELHIGGENNINDQTTVSGQAGYFTNVSLKWY